MAAFPRSFGRGLIEADGPTTLVFDGISFPRSFGRGLIEAVLALVAGKIPAGISAVVRPRPH